MNIAKYFQRGHPVREWGESIVIAVFMAVVIRTFLVQVYKIPTGSMRMTLLEGDRILVNKLRYGPKVPFTDWRLPGYGRLQRGDVIVFQSPEDPRRHFVKRLIGFPDEIVEIKERRIHINDQEIADERIRNFHYYNKGDFGKFNQKIKIPSGYYYVLGDNSSSSLDSRFFGFVPEEYLIGKAEFIYWPLNRIRILK